MASLCLAHGTTYAADKPSPKWQTGVSYFMEKGDYGTRTDTTLIYIPFSLRRYFSHGDVQITIPYVQIMSEGDVTLIEGVPNPTNPPTRVRRRETNDGLGDVVLRARYYLLKERKFFPQVDIVPRVKFPTASTDKGLGTGEFDEGLTTEFTKMFGNRAFAMGETGYTFIGEPPGQDFRNRWNYSVGAGYYLVPRKWQACVFLDERQSVIKGRENPRDVFFYTEVSATKLLKFHLGYELGLSDTAADYGVMAGTRFKF
jgi:hypothetical protein